MLLLMATLVGSWRYEGFAAEPVRRESAAPPPNTTVVPTPPAATAAIAIDEPPGVAAESPEPPKSGPPESIKATAPTRPTSWRLADASGQVWEHSDPVWLRYWVGERNASRKRR